MATLASSEPEVATSALPGRVFDFDVASVENGLPLESLHEFVTASGVPLRDLLEVVIPLRTLKHRRAKGQRLSMDESDKLARVARVFDHTVEVFGDSGKALRWLTKPKGRFDGKTPLEMLRTETGGRGVDQLLGQIAHGMFA